MGDPGQRVIVCATDLTEASRDALHTAVELAVGLGVKRVHILHVHEAERIESVDALLARWEERQSELKRQAEAEAVHVRQSRGEAPFVDFVIEIRVGKAYREILRYVLEQKADLVVVGTQGRTGLGHAVLGSVAERIARHAPCSVVVAKAPEVRAHLGEILSTSLAKR